MVEDVLVGGSVDRAEIVTVGPVPLCPKLLLHALVKEGAGERIGEGDTDIIGARVSYELDGLADYGPGLAGVSELQEEAGADASLSEAMASGVDGGDVEALVHRIENLLRTRFSAEPDLAAS